MSIWVALGILLGIIIILGLYIAVAYNRLIAYRNETDNAFSQIDVQLTRRYELIPNLVKIAKKYMTHEKETLTAVIEARNQAKAALDSAKQAGGAGAEKMQALASAEKQLGGQMGGFYALFENYPELKADNQMSQLTEEIASTENKVSFARQRFNDLITFYNNYAQQFPSVFVAKLFNFRQKDLLEIDDIVTKREAVVVDFDG